MTVEPPPPSCRSDRHVDMHCAAAWLQPSLSLVCSESKRVKHAHLPAGGDVLVRVLADKDVDPRVEHGSLQDGAAHPLPQEVSETSLSLRLQHTLIIL